jgi:hypothetical protein
VSLVVGRWLNPEGGEIVEFTVDGAMVVSRGGEVLTTQRYVVEARGAAGGRLSLRTEGEPGEVVLGYCVQADILAMSYGGQTTIYTQV